MAEEALPSQEIPKSAEEVESNGVLPVKVKFYIFMEL